MKLTFAPRSRSVRTRWLLEELGQPYELIRLPAWPEGFDTPLLVDRDLTLFHSAAALIYVADQCPMPRLAPELSSPQRGEYLQWLLFSESTLDQVVVSFLANATQPRDTLNGLLAFVERGLEGRTVAVGEAFSAVDVSLASVLHLANTLGLLEARPQLYDYTIRHAKRPAVRRALT